MIFLPTSKTPVYKWTFFFFSLRSHGVKVVNLSITRTLRNRWTLCNIRGQPIRNGTTTIMYVYTKKRKNGLRSLRQLRPAWSQNWCLGHDNPAHKKLPGNKCGENGQVVIWIYVDFFRARLNSARSQNMWPGTNMVRPILWQAGPGQVTWPGSRPIRDKRACSQPIRGSQKLEPRLKKKRKKTKIS